MVPGASNRPLASAPAFGRSDATTAGDFALGPDRVRLQGDGLEERNLGGEGYRNLLPGHGPFFRWSLL